MLGVKYTIYHYAFKETSFRFELVADLTLLQFGYSVNARWFARKDDVLV